MGSIWLHSLPSWFSAAGLNVTTHSGWQTRSRSSGGYDAIRGIGVHHTAGGSNVASQINWCWHNSSSRPIGAMLLAPNGQIIVGAAGATNTQGRGGPYTTSKGTIPKDAGNRYMVSIEAMNRGDGSPWPTAQQDAYVKMCKVLCDKLGLNPLTDVIAHFEWAPGRKIDPAGSSRWASGSSMWAMPAFRAEIAGSSGGGGGTPPPASSYNPPSNWGLYPLDTNKPTIRNGSSGEHVRYLQDALALGAGSDIARDGQFGNQTEQNVRQVQTAFKLTVDGVVGPSETWPVIDNFAASTNPPEPPPGDGVSAASPCRYYVRAGDSPWRVGEIVYGSGKKGADLLDAGAFGQANVYIDIPQTSGKSTKVKTGEGAYSVAKRLGGSIDAFYAWNGGESRTLHPGDTVYMPN